MNYFGLLTKQEAREQSDLKASMPTDQYLILEDIAGAIATCQKFTPEIKSNTFNRVVHDNIAGYFKNTMQYSVDDVKQGQPVNMTLLKTISWL